MSRPRFPERKRRPDGTWGCRGCGGDIPKGRLTWCGNACHQKYNPFWIKLEVAKRCDHKCQNCGKDCSPSARQYYNQTRIHPPCYTKDCGLNYPYDYEAFKAHPLYVAYLAAIKEWGDNAPDPEFDHITPHSEGGDFTVENIRLLCKKCHKERTKLWHKERKNRKTNELETIQTQGP